jgi:hypothetical protein
MAFESGKTYLVRLDSNLAVTFETPLTIFKAGASASVEMDREPNEQLKGCTFVESNVRSP